MKKNKKISIIIPVYKVEKYLNVCIESLVNQTYKDIEIILVDDGSPDNCPKICDDWIQKDKRIKVIHKLNGGVSSARNNALKHASGEYIMFIDSDDWINSDTLEIINKNLKDNDLLCFGYKKCYKDKKESVLIGNNINSKDVIMNNIFLNNNIGGLPWNKIFKKNIIVNNNITFNEELHFCEDLLFVAKYLQYCNKMYYINKTLYNYRVRKSSAVYVFNEKSTSVLLAYELIAKELKEEKYKNECYYRYILNYYRLRKQIKQSNINVNQEILKLEKKIIKNISIKEKIKFYITKYFYNIFIFLRKIKNNKIQKLYE